MISDDKREFYNSLRAKADAVKEIIDRETPGEDDEKELIDTVISFVGEVTVDIAESLERLATATEAQFD